MQRLLDKLLVSIRYEGLLESDVDDIVKITRDYFVKEKFVIREGTHKNIDVHLHDPETIGSTVSSKTEVIKKYIYTLNNIEIVVSKNSFDMVVSAVGKYDGFKYYSEYIVYFMKEIEKRFYDIVNITRIGVRKINNIYIRNIGTIGNYLNSNIFNCCNINETIGKENDIFLLSGVRHTMVGDKQKINLITESHLGDAIVEKDGEKEKIDIYRNVLDIDVYWDMSVEGYEKIKDKLLDLNKIVTNTYLKCLNDDFRSKLENDEVNLDENLVGGISIDAGSV